MGQNRCTRDEAIAILRTASRGRDIRLRDAAVSLPASLGQTGPLRTHSGY